MKQPPQDHSGTVPEAVITGDGPRPESVIRG